MRSWPSAVYVTLIAVGVVLLVVGSATLGRGTFWLSTSASVVGLLIALAGAFLLAERQGWKFGRSDSR